MDRRHMIEKRAELISKIEEWNAVRIELFGLSIPDENLVFHGVMRFFYMGNEGKYQTKCLRISSTTTASEIVDQLVQKFHPGGCDLSADSFALYEHQPSAAEDLKLADDQCPLSLQLSWINLEREGKFILKNQIRSNKSNSKTLSANNQTVKRRWSFRRDVLSAKGPTQSPSLLCDGGLMHATCTAPDPDSPKQEEPPDSTFTRTISDPEAAMRRKRQKTLEAKILNIINEGGSESGGALKIYGSSVCPEVPYKTILVSQRDHSTEVIAQSLEKYGLHDANPDNFVLVLRLRNCNPLAGTMIEREHPLSPTDRPLQSLLDATKSHQFSATVELRRRLDCGLPSSATTETLSELQSPAPSETSSVGQRLPPRRVSSLPGPMAYLIELSKEGRDLTPTKRARIIPVVIKPHHAVVLGAAAKTDLPNSTMLQLPSEAGNLLLPNHAVLWAPESSSPSSTKQPPWLLIRPFTEPRKGCVFVNGKQCDVPVRLCPGDVIRLGTSSVSGQQLVFKIVPPEHLSSLQQSPDPLIRPQFSTPQPAIHFQRMPLQHQEVRDDGFYRATVRGASRLHLPPPLPHHQQTHSLDGANMPRPPILPGRRESLSTCSSPSNTSESSISTHDVVWHSKNPRPEGPGRSASTGIGQQTTTTPSSSNRTSSTSRNSADVSSCVSSTVSVHSPPHPDASLSSSTTVKRSLTSKGQNGAPSVSDRLPCQLAYAPASLGPLMDWMLLQELANRECPLGPALSVYLMQRAICRQCDRWEAIEARQRALEAGGELPPDEVSVSMCYQLRYPLPFAAFVSLQYKPVDLSQRNILPFQWRRRRRQLLTVLLGAVDRLARHLSDESDPPLSSAAALLSNASLLLHLVQNDLDLNTTFSEQEGAEAKESRTTWRAICNRLADLVEQSFERLCGTVIDMLQCAAIPALLSKFTTMVTKLEEEDVVEEDLDQGKDPVLDWMQQVLTALTGANTNPAIIVQVFARLLHTVNSALFNFLIKSPRGSAFHTRVTPAWGTVLHGWIHNSLNAWALDNGLHLVADCYLQRLSQTADLMLADVKAVDSLYNLVVDLVRLNSVQVRELLTNYRAHCIPPKDLRLSVPRETRSIRHEDGDDSGVEDAALSGAYGGKSRAGEYEFEKGEEMSEQCPVGDRIPSNWIDFIVSGVSQVADKIQAEEESNSDSEELSNSHTEWRPELFETVELHLPFLLPVDSYASDNPLTANVEPSGDLNADAIVTVQSVAEFLKTPIQNGWCRLSMRPIKGLTGAPSWAVYLSLPSPIEQEEGSKNSEESRDSGLVRDYDVKPPLTTERERFETFDVVVPKIDSSLGLTILAAKSEDGQDLGIFIKSIVPGGGASHAQTVDQAQTPCPLQPGDRIISVDGKTVSGLSQEQAASLVAASGPKVRLTITRNLDLGRIAASLDIKKPDITKTRSSTDLPRTLVESTNKSEMSMRTNGPCTIKRAATFSYSLAASLKPPELLGAPQEVESDGSWDRKSELHSELLKTAQMLQNMRDELARCLDRRVTSPKTMRANGVNEGPVDIPVEVVGPRLNSSLSHVSLFSAASTSKAPPMAPKPTRFMLQTRGAKSTGDLREGLAKIHDFPAVVAIKEAAKSNSLSPVAPPRTMKSSGSSARHIASLHDRLMEEQRKRSNSADRSRIEVVLSAAQ